MRAPLDIGSILGGTFRIFFSRLPMLFLMAYLPTLLAQLAIMWIIGGFRVQLVADPGSVGLSTSATWTVFAIVLGLLMVGYGFATALIVPAAYDARLGHRSRLAAYVGVGLVRFVPVVLISVVVFACLFLGNLAIYFVFSAVISSIARVLGSGAGVLLLLAAIPAIYWAAMFSLAVVAIVVERVGIGAIGRSIHLTKDYRWPVVGTIILLGLCVGIVGYVLDFAMTRLILAAGIQQFWLFFLTSAATMAIPMGLMSVGLVLLYARLREIKEGTSVQSLAQVFD
ncbi:MAG: hypothetical protein AAFX39_01820 [Pseudomonadota bacterium]